MNNELYVKGARAHNLKNIDIVIPKNKLVVVTGLSGSGKSSLVFDTIFAEGQRRYIESLSSYARQFLGQLDKPDVESITGLSPTISIDQKSTFYNPRSTVGTVTEIYDYMRLLFARIGIPHCPVCGKEICKQSVDQILDRIMMEKEGTKLYVLAPVIRGRKGEYTKLFEDYQKQGYLRFKVDGAEVLLGETEIKLDKQVKHNISVIVDRLVIKGGIQTRLTDSIENAVKLSGGLICTEANGEEKLYSTLFACPDCGVSIEELEPRMFSFNTPYGACPTCGGLGYKMEVDEKRLIRDENASIRGGALNVAGWNMDGGKIAYSTFVELSRKYGFSLDVPYKTLPEKVKNLLMYGSGDIITIHTTNSFGAQNSWQSLYEGLVPMIMRRYSTTTSDAAKREYERLMIEKPCTSCGGKRLKRESLAVTIAGLNIHEVCSLSVSKLDLFISSLRLTNTEGLIAGQIMKEIKARVRFLIDVGLDYLTLSRYSNTLSGGEAQRIRLATQIGSGLTNILYILDEPSIGLHQKDNARLIETLKKLRDTGNTLIVVEHDEETMRAADHIVDIGPGAGVEGGRVVAQGTLTDILNCKESITGMYLRGERAIPIPLLRREGNGHSITVKGATQNNLKNLTVDFPLGKFIVVTGVSGSGKSSLINGILYPYLANHLNNARQVEGKAEAIEGLEYVDKVICIDQAPIGRTPRSNPATYTGVFNAIRDLFAATADAKMRGYTAGRFSFNVSGGRCEHCKGDGMITIAMHFLPDVFVPCEVCHGKRYNRETLEVRFKGKSISDVLDMTVAEAVEFFANIPTIYNKIKTLFDVGLSYIKLGQPATTLSGGEAQRVKLATELAKRSTGKTVYILDEPTTGLHVADVDKLISILNKLANAGNTVIIIEHNLDVIKVADHLIDLGKDGGERGGNIVVCGTPEEVAACTESYTGEFLAKLLNAPSQAGTAD